LIIVIAIDQIGQRRGRIKAVLVHKDVAIHGSRIAVERLKTVHPILRYLEWRHFVAHGSTYPDRNPNPSGRLKTGSSLVSPVQVKTDCGAGPVRQDWTESGVATNEIVRECDMVRLHASVNVQVSV
jgi:hypothetical protein